MPPLPDEAGFIQPGIGENIKGSTMNNQFFKALALFALVTLSGTASVLCAPKESRIHGTLKGTVTFAPTNIVAGVYMVKVEAAGALSHLGRSKAVWEGNVSLSTNLQATPLGGLGWKLTGAEGSTLQGTIQWQASSTNHPGIYSLTGTLQSTGGPGRDQNATGHGTITATLNARTHAATLQVNGLLSPIRRNGR
jgi:hypothetical protein